MFNCTVKFGPECSPTDITTASESLCVLLANLSPLVPYDDEFQDDIIGRYGHLEDITLNESETAVTAAIQCSEYNKANDAVAQLDGQTFDSMILSAQLDSVAETRVMPPSVSRSVKISWPVPSCFAWVYYPTITIAKAQEKRLDGMDFNGRKIKAEFPKPRLKQIGPFPIKITGLPADTVEDTLRKFCPECKLIQIGKPPYSTPPVAKICAFLQDHGSLESLDILPSKRAKAKITAFARFNADSSLLSDLTALNGVKQPFLGNSTLWIQPVFHAKYTVPRQHFQLVHGEITQLCDTYKDQCSILIDDIRDQPTIHLSGSLENGAIFGRINVALQTLLHGEPLLSNGEKVWNEYFDLSSGATAVDKLNAKKPYFIILDHLSQTVRIIGAETARQQARATIPRLLAKVRDLRRTVPLNRFHIAPLMNGGMQRLLDDLGGNKVTLDVQASALIVRGDTAVHDQVHQYLNSCTATSWGTAASEGRESSCIACCRRPHVPIKLSCRHVYCEACLQHVLRSCLGSPFTPPRCIAMAEVSEAEPPELDLQCTEYIPYTVVRDVLPTVDEVSFLRSSFLSHIRTRPEEFFFCPVPNCETIYRSGKADTVYRCPSCSTRVCSTCHVEYHEGLACDERLSITPVSASP
jgi:hypothetical protein